MTSIPGSGSVQPTQPIAPGAASTAPASTAPVDSGSASVSRTSAAARHDVARSLDGLSTVSRIRVEPEAQSYVEGALASLPRRDAATTRRLLREASGIDGNKVLTLEEAEAVIDPILLAQADGADVRAALRGVDSFLDTLAAQEADVMDGVDLLFNSDRDGPSLTERVISEIDQTVEEANGRPFDINVMIFSFTDQSIADKLVEVARNNPNGTIRMIGDWTQLSRQYQLGKLDDLQIPNLQIKVKKDQPYTWDASSGRTRWNHSTTRGLNHHKGFVTLIDGEPRSMVAGSFNWSPTAEHNNYENLMAMDASAPENRLVMRHYEAEFEAFWNDGGASFTADEAREHRRLLTAEFRADPTMAPTDVVGLASGAGDSIDLLAGEDVLDLNDWAAADRIADLFGGGEDGLAFAQAMHAERKQYGRFASLDDLIARIPAVGDLDPAELEAIGDSVVFGHGTVSVNFASVDDLRAIGASNAAAEAIVAHRDVHGDFESLLDVKDLPGVSNSSWNRIKKNLNGEMRRVSFSARRADEAAGDTGYATVNEEKLVPVLGADGVVHMESATLGSGAVDIMRRAESGETLKLAAYGLSSSTPEYAALIGAARRGVKVRVILNKAYNERVAQGLKDLASAEGLDIEVKTSGRTMHQKYLVHPESNDVFNGSANLSSSSARKHSEDRFAFKNNPQIAAAFETDFNRLWGRLQ